MVLCCWAKGYQEPVYLVSNLATAEEACRLYQKGIRLVRDTSYPQSLPAMA